MAGISGFALDGEAADYSLFPSSHSSGASSSSSPQPTGMPLLLLDDDDVSDDDDDVDASSLLPLELLVAVVSVVASSGTQIPSRHSSVGSQPPPGVHMQPLLPIVHVGAVVDASPLSLESVAAPPPPVGPHATNTHATATHRPEQPP